MIRTELMVPSSPGAAPGGPRGPDDARSPPRSFPSILPARAPRRSWWGRGRAGRVRRYHPRVMTAPTTTSTAPHGAAEKFPPVFWIANVTELFERAAYYAVASFVVIYLGQLGFGDYWPSTLNGSVLWTLIYFLPILSGTIADQIGYRRALLLAGVLLAIGYSLVGAPVWFGGAVLSPTVEKEFTATAGVVVPVVAGLLLIGIGGSFVKPCILGTAQKVSGTRATLAFAIFYMVVNIGSLVGRTVSYFVRTRVEFSLIFAVAAACSLLAFLMALLFYRDPGTVPGSTAPQKPKRSVGQILLDMVRVLTNGRFVVFLLVSSGFFFLYNQVYNVLPLYWKRVLETNPPVDVYTMANPLVIVCFQLLVTRLFGKIRPIRSIVIGTVIIGLSMAINLWPIYSEGGMRREVLGGIPIGSVVIVATVGLIAFGELFTSARMYEYIGGLAPKGQEGLFLGYANLPLAIGSLVGGPVGAAIFNEVICKGATKLPNGLLELDPAAAARGWVILMLIGFASALAIWVFNVWLERQERAAA
ncbi:peptide MFS transporter [Acidobacteria bacterium ACD]|nr:MAG: MFS transporter [Acidobacteriota bacterium]MDL1951217.1 peptide MFS transporter [Acidobacteria bacterium ACD]